MNKYIDMLFSFPGRGGKTFEAMQRLDALLDHPHKEYKTIHVAGTNGKGSVALKIASVLQRLGYRVGLYTSPHLYSYQERIQINNELISEYETEEILSEIFPKVQEKLSFFDLMTCLAFVYFARKRVDYAVIEVGLGGRLDATNIITPIATAITSIGMEHQAILGDTLEKIAFEKGGIKKKGVPLVVGHSAAPFFPEGIPVNAAPFYEWENRAIAQAVLKTIGISSTDGIEAIPPCRFEQMGDLIFDVAHNPPAFERLVQALELHFPGKRFPFYVAFSKDKDWKKCIEIISNHASTIHFIQSENPRLLKLKPCVKAEEIREGVITGSFYIMDEVRRAIQMRVGE